MILDRKSWAVRQICAKALVPAVLLVFFAAVAAGGQGGGTSASAKPIGTIKTISGNAITLTSDSGPVFNVTLTEDTKIVRIEPGAKDLKSAGPLPLQDLQVGDRILVLGMVLADGHSVTATSVVAVKKADVTSKQEKDRLDWQKNGVGGLVSEVDAAAGTITISTQSVGGPKGIVIRVLKTAIVRRYAADSVKFDDAKPSSLDQIKAGDQVRARGTRNVDGTELAANEVVSGAFRNIAGTVATVDPVAHMLSVVDLVTKKTVTVKITSESQLRKLPPQMAQVMARRLKGGATDSSSPEGTAQGSAAAAGTTNGTTGATRGGPGGAADLQQMLSRVPPTPLSDLQKGDAVMIVSTEGTDSGGVTAITLVAGVEPLLQAAPNGGQSMILPPWSLDAPGGDAAQ